MMRGRFVAMYNGLAEAPRSTFWRVCIMPILTISFSARSVSQCCSRGRTPNRRSQLRCKFALTVHSYAFAIVRSAQKSPCGLTKLIQITTEAQGHSETSK
jgi:hypothetical protein